MKPDKIEFTITRLAIYNPPEDQWIKNELWIYHKISAPDHIHVEPMWNDFYEDEHGIMVQDYKILCEWDYQSSTGSASK